MRPLVARRFATSRLAGLILAGLWLTPAPAFAHAFLVRAVPAVGATVMSAPARLTLSYTEGVVPHFCQVTVTGPGGATVATGRPHAEPGHPAVLLVRLPHLTPGRYTVTWHAVATDTHRTQGQFRFTVAGGAP
ncbi:MAG: copper resistance protein CopC [Acetobacteraceae bacterium]